jgi:hypothetical protein
VLLVSFSNAGPNSSKWRFRISGDNAKALHAKADSCFADWETVLSSTAIERPETTYSKAMEATMINTNDVFMDATLQVQVSFKSIGIFRGDLINVVAALLWRGA